jgi:UDP-perosamine 4-acetyltransferase
MKSICDKRGLKMKKSILLLGAKGTAKMALEILREQNAYSAIALLDNFADETQVFTYPIIGKCDEVAKYKADFTHAFVCIADPQARKHFLENAMASGYEIPNIISNRAYISPSARLGAGVFANAFAAVQAHARLGDGCLLNTGAVVEHDNELGECVTFGTNATTTGNVAIGSYTFVGANSCIINHKSVGKNVIIAAGATVTSDVPDNVMVAGTPAKIKKSIE